MDAEPDTVEAEAPVRRQPAGVCSAPSTGKARGIVRRRIAFACAGGVLAPRAVAGNLTNRKAVAGAQKPECALFTRPSFRKGKVSIVKGQGEGVKCQGEGRDWQVASGEGNRSRDRSLIGHRR